MRENLYRGKRVDNGEWVEGYYVKLGRTAYIFTGNVLMTKHGDDYGLPCTKPEKYQVIPETVGQYTGLPDKNGKKIFEGHIVKHYCDGNNHDNYDIGRVFWNSATCTVLRTSAVDEQCPEMWDSCEYEIMGNIHDNPELLKGGAV